MSKLDIPESWATSTLGECVEIVGGATPDSANSKFFVSQGEGIPWVTPADLGKQKEKYISNGSRDITEDGFKSCSTKMLPPDSILFSSRAPIGHVAISANPICTNQGFKSIKTSPFFSSPFLYFYLLYSKDKIASMGSGTTFKEVSGAVMKQVELLIPPLEEQKRIAAKIESTQAKINEIESCTMRAGEQIEKYREALLQKAFRGVLVPQDPNDEPASTLLERLRRERAKQSDCKKKKKDDLPPIKPEEIPFEIPKSWEWIRIGELNTATGNTPKKVGNKVNDFPFYKPGDISYVGPIFIEKSEDFTSLDYNSRRVSEGTVLLVCIGATLGKVGIVSRAGAYNQQINSIETGPHIVPEFLTYWMRSKTFQHLLWKGVSSTTMPIVNKSDMGNLLFPLPPLKEQKLIANLIASHENSLFNVISKFETINAVKNQLSSSILATAFSGQLVPQDSTEGTGQELLERIISAQLQASESKTFKKDSALKKKRAKK